ncbi:CopD family copper resistance protein [Actomonas aquatica]|uniref:Copper resistance protein D domain-containing protein n=1 Tax=Actomonas aquatica TaxID=2866162 RepID=A0ABZ1C513_9BACT|nr:hypothetical protein [Opitutus sp. WL0086]WRQ86566.1 hypothetical protein K1X11_017275 [Opitutus sp. WL0086]
MAYYYGLFVTVHLLCAITFAGAVFFEVLVIEPLEKKLPPGLGAQLAEAIPGHVRKFMPVIVGLLFLTGGAMYWIHYSTRPDFFSSRFGILLTIKMTLAFAVLGVFVTAIRASIKGTMDLCRFRYTHRIVAGLMLAIVLLAKGMFYL